MSLFAVAKNQAADAITIDKITLHSGDPGTGTSNELSTAGGIYSAKAIAFGAAADGVRTQSADVLFDVPAGASVSHYCLWQGTTAKKKGAFTATEVYAAQGQHRVKEATITIIG